MHSENSASNGNAYEFILLGSNQFMARVKNVSGPALQVFVVLLATAITYALWMLTEPFLGFLGAAKYLLIPAYALVAVFSALPVAFSLLVFAAMLFTQFSALRHLASKSPATPKSRQIEYYEYDDDTREYVKKTGYF